MDYQKSVGKRNRNVRNPFGPGCSAPSVIADLCRAFDRPAILAAVPSRSVVAYDSRRRSLGTG